MNWNTEEYYADLQLSEFAHAFANQSCGDVAQANKMLNPFTEVLE